MGPFNRAMESQWRGVLVLLATVTATELVFLNVIFWVQAQGSIPGLVLAVVWPWVAAFAAPLVWANRTRWLPSRPRLQWTLHPRLSLGIGLALAAAMLVARLVAVA
jgi:hypothetical protein